ncbi:PREDICTED: transmembrane protein 119-like [Cyprinodon variegatus]|uniref:transmembrane protein 119-like n=1 Tax=Cyprinodon variegatus TaxID=28743 RepID=UPI000742B688|nr:PREDICTED: transmembrane protein 119-like [Cyprinodon variegatus]
MHPEALYPISLCLVFCLSRSLATHLPLYSPLEGSTDEEELSYINSSVFTGVHPTEYQTTPPEPSQEQRTLPTEFATFLEENMLLILVSTILIFLTFLITCGAFFMSRRLKVNSYHPCSFPSKMYVDHQDKTGGTKIFCEVQGKVVPELELEAVDSNKQLQEEILRAASSLRTPKKCAPAAERSEAKVNAADQSTQDNFKPDCSILDKQLPTLLEEEQCEVSDNREDEEASKEQPKEQQLREDSEEPLTGRSLRPSSLHIHNETATLQLIAGEKTAF